MYSKVEIINFAIGHLGVGKYIATAEERSSEALAAARWWNMARRKTLRAWRWPFAKTFADLGLVQNNPTLEWAFSYRYPADAVDLHRILSGLARDNSSSAVPYIISSDTQGKLILTNKPCAQIQYTRDVELINIWDDDFAMAMSAFLAWCMCPQLVSNDEGVLQKMIALATQYINDAKANASDEEMSMPPPEAESIRAREGECGYGFNRNEMYPW